MPVAHKRFVMGMIVLVMLVPLLAACDSGGNSTPATPTEVAIVRRLATIPPTATRDPNAPLDLPSPTPSFAPPPSATPYVGQFLGEVGSERDLLSIPGGNNSGELPPVQIIVGESSSCEFPIDPVFGERWRTESRATNGLGCPIQVMFGFEARVQVFENGIIYTRTDTNEVWAISPGGLTIVGAHWNVSQLPLISAVGFVPPGGLLAPTNEAISAVWAGVPEVRESLGWATADMQTVGVNIQRFNGGTLFLDVSTAQVFALLVNGDAYGPYQGLPQ
jgi:hypothetical protein